MVTGRSAADAWTFVASGLSLSCRAELVSCLPNIRTGTDIQRDALQSLKLPTASSPTHTQLHFTTDSQYEREKII